MQLILQPHLVQPTIRQNSTKQSNTITQYNIINELQSFLSIIQLHYNTI